MLKVAKFLNPTMNDIILHFEIIEIIIELQLVLIREKYRWEYLIKLWLHVWNVSNKIPCSKLLHFPRFGGEYLYYDVCSTLEGLLWISKIIINLSCPQSRIFLFTVYNKEFTKLRDWFIIYHEDLFLIRFT